VANPAFVPISRGVSSIQAFSAGTVNGAAVHLKTSEEIQLTDSSGNVIGTPSAPSATGDGFNECTWTNVCS
jgi:hypothetical protein